MLNHDGGGVAEENGKLLGFTVDASEKLYADYQFSSLNAGGHSSMPTADNAIYHLADALGPSGTLYLSLRTERGDASRTRGNGRRPIRRRRLRL